MSTEPNKETYLGDGVYASYDGYQIALRAPRHFGDDFVFLDKEVYQALVRFAGEALQQ